MTSRARGWSRIQGDVENPQHRAGPRAGGAPALALRRARRRRDVVDRDPRAPSVGDAHDADLTVVADAMLTSRLGPHARAALVGPARLELLGPPGDARPRACMRARCSPSSKAEPGARWIEAADLVVEIVGTLFAIEVHGDEACVAVSHGTVRVTARTAVQP
ncbi:MAG: hypothetical protein IPQ07_41315 [Myxococcales bacterium]|nr:hypothetical protein [Myxococcales bacterium]